MLRAFSTAATGMTAQQTMVDVIANNLANVNTNGFKRSQVNFQDLLYTQITEPGVEVSSGVTAPVGLEIGNGVRVGDTTKVFSPGEVENTARNLDVAIQGNGLFQVTSPTGELRYTRDGSLQINGTGELVNAMGYTLGISGLGAAKKVEIGADGTVTIFDASGTSSSAGTLQLANFPNPAGLRSEGNNLLSETLASGTATLGTAGQTGLGTLQAGFLEKANVQMVTELVNLIKAQRAYEMNSRAIRAGDDMLRTANDVVR
jgi:flagellar basal-body rod protein FlgG